MRSHCIREALVRYKKRRRGGTRRRRDTDTGVAPPQPRDTQILGATGRERQEVPPPPPSTGAFGGHAARPSFALRHLASRMREQALEFEDTRLWGSRGVAVTGHSTGGKYTSCRELPLLRGPHHVSGRVRGPGMAPFIPKLRWKGHQMPGTVRGGG